MTDRGRANVKPLVSPVVEYRIMAVLEIVAGAGLMVAFAMADGVAATAAPVLAAAAFFGVLMYLFVYRRTAREVLQDPARAPTPARENTAKTIRRAVLLAGALLALAALATLLDVSAHGVAGIALGNGAVLWLASGRLKRWELRSGRRLLREPRWRWDGRGIADPRDFYVDEAAAPSSHLSAGDAASAPPGG